MQFVDAVCIQLRPQDGITVLCEKRNHRCTCLNSEKWYSLNTGFAGEHSLDDMVLESELTALSDERNHGFTSLKVEKWYSLNTGFAGEHSLDDMVHEDELIALCVEMNHSFTRLNVEKWHSLNRGLCVGEHSLDDMVLEDELPTARLQFHAVFWSIWWTDCHGYMKNSLKQTWISHKTMFLNKP